MKSSESQRGQLLLRLTPGLAHEIRGPLTTISGIAQVVAAESTLSQEHRPYLQLVQSQVERIDLLLTTLSRFVRAGDPVDDGDAPATLADVIEGAVLLLAHELRAAGVEPAIELYPDSPPVAQGAPLMALIVLLVVHMLDLGQLNRLTIRSRMGSPEEVVIELDAAYERAAKGPPMRTLSDAIEEEARRQGATIVAAQTSDGIVWRVGAPTFSSQRTDATPIERSHNTASLAESPRRRRRH